MLAIQDIRRSIASLARAPGFALGSVLSLSVPLAAFLILTGVNSAILYKQLPYQNPERLVVTDQLTVFENGKSTENSQSTRALELWYRKQQIFEAMVLVTTHEALIENAPDQPLVKSTYTTPEYFHLFKVPVLVGRGFDERESIDSSANNVLISESLWRNSFSGRQDILEQSLIAFNQPWRIIGVVSEDFNEPSLLQGGRSGVWFPWYPIGDQDNPWQVTYEQRKAVGLMHPGVQVSDVQIELQGLLDGAEAEWREGWNGVRAIAPNVLDFREAELGGSHRLTLYMLAGSIALLLVAAVNVANLFLARVAQKRQNFAIQAVLGAKRGDLFLEMLTESLWVCVLAFALAIPLAYLGLVGFKKLAAGYLPMLYAVTLDWVALAPGIIATLAISFFFAFYSVQFIRYRDLSGEIHGSGKGVQKKISPRTVWLLTFLQVGMTAFIFLSGSLFAAKAAGTVGEPVGADLSSLYNFHAFTWNDVKSGRHEQITKDIKAAFNSLPAVEGITAARFGPVRNGPFTTALYDSNAQPIDYFETNWIDEEYFDVVETELLAGSMFDHQDIVQSTSKIIVSEAAAKSISPGGNVVGKTVLDWDKQPHEIIGVVANTAHPRTYPEDMGARIYYSQDEFGFPFNVRMKDGFSLSKQDALEVTKGIDSSLFIYEFHDIEHVYRDLTHKETLTLWLTTALALLAALLGCFGIYGVSRFGLLSRYYELGIRIAVGAKRHEIFRETLLGYMKPVLVGYAFAAIAVGVFYKFSPVSLQEWVEVDLTYFAGATLAILCVAVLGITVPLIKVLDGKITTMLRDE